MKKVSFGSFPLNEIRADDRKCLDRYLIKTFADNISISDAIRNLGITKNLMYITPDTLMRDWLGGDKSSHRNSPDRTGSKMYDQALKRAFYILKEFYKKIQHSPFYKEYVYYPIYVEKIDRVDVKNPGDDSAHTEVQMNYSFVILSNDLTKSLKIDEIKFDENASLNFLFLFVEFFSAGDFNHSIHDYDKTHHEFLVQLYQFIEESGKDPIHMVLDLYKLMGLVKDAVEGKTSNTRLVLGQRSNKLTDQFSSDNLKKYKGMIKHKIMDMNRTDKTYRDAFMDIIKAILRSEGLNGLYDGVDSSADLGERYAYVYNSNKYREILNLSKELVDYNKDITLKNIISSDPMDFDFSVEKNSYSIDTKQHLAAQKYQAFFKLYVESIASYIEGIVTTIMNGLNIDAEVNAAYVQNINDNTAKIVDLETDLIRLENNKAATDIRRAAYEDEAKKQRRIGGQAGNQAMDDALTNMRKQEKLLDRYAREIGNLDKEIQDLKIINKLNQGASATITKEMNNIGGELYKNIKNSVLASIANDLTFIFDDGKRLFTNELVATGAVNLKNDSRYSPLTFSGFKNIVDNFASTTVFPKTIDDNNGSKPNPDYYLAQVIKSLQDSFDVMADDTLTAISDAILPAVQLTVSGGSRGKTADFNENIHQEILDRVISKVNSGSFMPTNIQEELSTKIYRDRFITKVISPIVKIFEVREVDSIIKFDQEISQLHPLIKKLLKNGSKGEYFKSFIINYDTCEQLYKTKFIVDTQKFLSGISGHRSPPRRLSSPMNRLQEVLFNYLGLKDNPVWVISKTDVYLSMPDSLSLTNTSILSKIPKTDLMEVCKIKASDYWNENSMSKVASFGNPALKKLQKDLKTVEEKIKKLKTGTKKEKPAEKERRLKRLEQERKKLDNIEERINKARHDDKQFTPNAFLFADDDANKAENTPLLTDAEKADLDRSKEGIKNSILKLNPFDDEEQANMQTNADNQTLRTLPFDLENTDQEEESVVDKLKKNAEEEERAFEEFQRLRRESQENRDR